MVRFLALINPLGLVVTPTSNNRGGALVQTREGARMDGAKKMAQRIRLF